MSEEEDVQVWRDLRLDTKEPHTWAFFHYLRRTGDRVRIIRRDKRTMDIEVTRPKARGVPHGR